MEVGRAEVRAMVDWTEEQAEGAVEDQTSEVELAKVMETICARRPSPHRDGCESSLGIRSPPLPSVAALAGGHRKQAGGTRHDEALLVRAAILDSGGAKSAASLEQLEADAQRAIEAGALVGGAPHSSTEALAKLLAASAHAGRAWWSTYPARPDG